MAWCRSDMCDCDVWSRRWGLRGSAEWLVLLFLLCAIQSVSLKGRRTLLVDGCLMLFPLRLVIPVELVRGGIALGEANGWVGDDTGMATVCAEADSEVVGDKAAACDSAMTGLGRERITPACNGHAQQRGGLGRIVERALEAGGRV